MDPLSHANRRLLDGAVLTEDEAGSALECLMVGGFPATAASAFLLGLRQRGETAAELAGAVRAVRAAMRPLASPEPWLLVDTCGTGGGRVTTLNISTAAAFVVAAAGTGVAKHGNRSHTSRSGSADVLEALGLPIDLPVAEATSQLERERLVFLHAPAHHPAMRHLAPVRRALGVPTIMNLVGPLANPAGVERQVVGVAEATRGPVVAEALRLLGTRHALVVHAEVGMDEVSPVGRTRTWEVRDGSVRASWFDPASVDLEAENLDGLAGGSPGENAGRIEQVLEGRDDGAATAAVLLNAAAGIYVGPDGGDWPAAADRAREALASGAARALLERLRRPVSARTSG